MQGLFPTFQKDRQPVSAGTLSALIQLRRQDLLTGLIDVSYPNDEQVLLFFNVGTPFLMYFHTEGAWRKVPATQWTDIFSRANGLAATLPLGGDALRTCLLALESERDLTGESALRPQEFKSRLEQARSGERVSLFKVRDEALLGLVIVAGNKLPIQDAIVFSSDGLMNDARALTRLTASSDRTYQVSHFEFADMPVFMQEYALRVAFVALTQPALQRFEELAGDTLADSLGKEVSNYALHQGWRIQFFRDRVAHRQYFTGPTEAVVAYRSLYRVIQHYIHRVVGAALTTSILREGVSKLPGLYRAVYDQQNFISA